MSYIEAPKPDGSFIGKITRKIQDRLPRRIHPEQELQRLSYQVIKKTLRDIKESGWVSIMPYSEEEEWYHLNLKAEEKRFLVFMCVESEGDSPTWITLGVNDDLPDGQSRRDFLFGGHIDDLTALQELGEHDSIFQYTKIDLDSHSLSFGKRLNMSEKLKFLQELMSATVDTEATRAMYEKWKSRRLEFVLWARDRSSPRLR